MVDYRSFRLNKLNTPEFSHLKLLFYWPLYGVLFFLLERVLPLNFHEVHCALDDLIPFCELFVIPYYLWFVFIIGMLAYLAFFDIPNFKKYMWFIIISYSVALVVYFVYPTCQYLRPAAFERDNILTRIVTYLYAFDTNTNVCPSIHVIGMMASFFSGIKTQKMKGIGWKIFWVISAIIVSFSTVFLKQHSIIDVAAGLVVSFATYFIVYAGEIFVRRKNRKA